MTYGSLTRTTLETAEVLMQSNYIEIEFKILIKCIPFISYKNPYLSGEGKGARDSSRKDTSMEPFFKPSDLCTIYITSRRCQHVTAASRDGISDIVGIILLLYWRFEW